MFKRPATFVGASYILGATFGGVCSFGRATFWEGTIFGWTLLSEIFKDLLNLPLLSGGGCTFGILWYWDVARLTLFTVPPGYFTYS